MEGDARSVDDVINDIGFGPFQLLVVLLCGLGQAVDMMQVQFAAIVSQNLQCVWRVSDLWKSLVALCTFAGMLVGCYLWGPLADRYCRRSVCGVCLCIVAFYGLLTAAAPNMLFVLVLRLLVGIGVAGGQSILPSMVNEFSPRTHRGLCFFLYECFWSIGVMLETALAALLLPLGENGWRYLALATAVPVLLVLLPWQLWLPPSPRQSLVFGDEAAAKQTLNRIASFNRSRHFSGRLQMPSSATEKGSFSQLWVTRRQTRLTLLLAVLHFAGGFGFYGVGLLVVQLQLVDSDTGCRACHEINFLQVAIPAAADAIASLANAFIVDRLLPRRVAMATSYGAAGALMPLMAVAMPSGARTAVLFAAKFLLATGYSTMVLYAQEAYPTTLRTTAFSFQKAFSRIASIVAPLIAQVFLWKVSLIGSLCIFGSLLLLAALAAAVLPLETKGMALAQTSDELQLVPGGKGKSYGGVHSGEAAD